MKAGRQAFRESQWQDALSDYAAAEKIDQTGLASYWLGNIHLALGSYSDFVSAWDRAVAANHNLSIPVCHAHGITQCEIGRLGIGRDGVTYKIGSHTDLEAPLTSVKADASREHKFAGYADFTLLVNGKKYDFIFMPYGAACQVLAHIDCDAKGFAQQKAVADYVIQLVPKLAAAR
jgi:hypothetical protein